jgi:hypothetical protein
MAEMGRDLRIAPFLFAGSFREAREAEPFLALRRLSL